jgi:hypothetical protein
MQKGIKGRDLRFVDASAGVKDHGILELEQFFRKGAQDGGRAAPLST